MKDIVIIANFCRDFSKNDNGRFTYLAKELSKGNKVEIVTTDFNHDTKNKKLPIENIWPFDIVFLKEAGYKKNISLRRFYSHFTWGVQVAKYLKNRKKPDVVYCAVPSLTAPFFAAHYCKKNNVRFVIDIQDLWPEAFKMVFNIPIISDVIFYPFTLLANSIYRSADIIIGVSKTYTDRAVSVNNKYIKVLPVFLGTNLKIFDENSILEIDIQKNDDDLWLGYCGSLSASYDLGSVIKSLKEIKDNGGKPPKLIVMGDGPRKKEFVDLARELDINCDFTGKLNYDAMCACLCKCDIAVNPITIKSAASIINKHGDYAASGLPVINTQNSDEYKMLVEKYNMGINCSNNNYHDMAEKISFLILNENLRKEMGKNARRCAEEKFDRRTTYKQIVDCMEEDSEI